MSRKHIQLTDSDSNILYPVAPTIIIEWDSLNKISSIPSSTITNNAITNDMVVVNWIAGNPKAMASDWSVTTGEGTCQVTNGTVRQNESTTLKLFLQHGLEVQGV